MNESGLRPMEFNVVIRMDPTEQKTPGGIILPTTKTERDELATDQGTLVATSPLAFTYANDSEWNGQEPPALGDRVMFAQYAGRIWKPKGDNGPTYRILKDKDIVAVIDQQPALAAAA